MTFPKQTPEYLAAKAPLKAAYDAARAPHWERYCAGEINHEQYCTLVDEAFCTYSNALEPHWVKAGGSPNPKSKTLAQLNAEYAAKWGKSE